MAKTKKTKKNTGQTCDQATGWKSFLLYGGKPGEKPVARDWILLLIMAPLVLALFLLVSGQLFWTTFFGESTKGDVDNTSKSIVVQRMQLEEVLERFESKKNKFEELKNNPPQVVDPSL